VIGRPAKPRSRNSRTRAARAMASGSVAITQSPFSSSAEFLK
jgi:hypothetical protein